MVKAKKLGGRAVAVLSLVREYGPEGTNGSLLLNGRFICHTIELPWRGNEPMLSCIPEGRYRVARQIYHRHGDQLGILQVPHREAILIHAANNAGTELKGCIAPVMTLTGCGRGIQSQPALQKLKDAVYPLMEQGVKVWMEIRRKSS